METKPTNNTTVVQEPNRKELKKKLGHGDLNRIKDLSRTSLSTVWRWFNEGTLNGDVEAAFNALMEKKAQDLQDRIENLNTN
jgi:hypothetical protein